MDLDPRINAFRTDIADSSLQFQVKAANYVDPKMRQCIKGILPIYAAASTESVRLGEVHYGEFVDLFETRPDGFSWVQNRFDRSVGYVQTSAAFFDQISDLSNRVCALRSFVYAKPDALSPVVDQLTFGSSVCIDGTEGGFSHLISGGYIWGQDIALYDEVMTPDSVFTAGQLLGTPYLSGGRSILGVDEGGLVQLALQMSGIEIPHAPDLQKLALGQELHAHWRDIAWRRGDVVFFENHVGLITTPDSVIHMSPETLHVTEDRLEELVMSGFHITAMYRS